ncbi:MAG: biopolymer transporter Tol [Verrucomicrobiae bacterium]|nr:biopolymer transporter Tol [Verrucomicrobiae bacterium]
MRPAFDSRGLFLFFAMTGLAGIFSIHAQVTITGFSDGTIPISVPILSGASGSEATAILTKDLERSGWFKVVSSGGEYKVEGSASGTGVQGKIFKRDGTVVGSATGAAGNLRRSVHQVTDAIVEKVAQKKGIAQTHIAFISDKSGHKELYVMDYDGYNVMRLTSDNSMVVSPHFSPKGNKIAYTSYKSAYPDVYVSDYPTGSRQAVSRFPGLNSGASFSPDGLRLALTLSKDGNPELYTMSVGGGSLKRLTRTRGGESSPTWSPDGSQLAYASDEGGRPQIYIISSAGGAGNRITSSPAYNTEPDWSAETGLIAYSSLRGEFCIAILDPKNGKSEVACSDGRCEDPSWARDGRHLVFTRTTGRHSELYVLDTVTKQVTQLTRNFGECSEPSWSGR